MKHFFDLPVYRLQEDEYFSQREQRIQRKMYASREDRAHYARFPDSAMRRRHSLEQEYGGTWIFNEIVAYIRLHFLGYQIRGEYFHAYRERVVRTRSKHFEWVTHDVSPEISLDRDACDLEIFFGIQQYIEDCRERLPQRYIDDSLIETLGPYMGWRALMLSQPSSL